MAGWTGLEPVNRHIASIEILTRGVLSPSEDELQRVIEEIARTHLGMEPATDELNEALNEVEARARYSRQNRDGDGSSASDR
jgi:hypothetical protein